MTKENKYTVTFIYGLGFDYQDSDEFFATEEEAEKWAEEAVFFYGEDWDYRIEKVEA